MKNIRFIYLKISFLVVNVSVYLNKHVFVMCVLEFCSCCLFNNPMEEFVRT